MSDVILTAAEIRAAEQRAAESGTSVETLMERAGAGAAEAIWRYANPVAVLILCGPGNNGGDGYVIARRLKERGVAVRVAAAQEVRTEAALRARSLWTGSLSAGTVEPLDSAAEAPVLVDALFGTGLRRPLDEETHGALGRLAARASIRIAIDLPSGIESDDGRILSPVPEYDLTIALAALKPAHLLQPAAAHVGRLALVDIGIEAASALHRIGRPSLPSPGPCDHKYSRGMVAVLAGAMPGAAALAASAALRSGAGYVRLSAERAITGLPSAIVQGECPLDDPRIGALLIGPGLGRGADSAALLERALASGLPLVLDADALILLGGRPERLASLRHQPILTPHSGEFDALFGRLAGSKVDRARAAARKAGAILLLKGADTVIAAPDGRAAIAPPAPNVLASAGTGDVLAGIVASLRAQGLDPFDSACAAVWLHGRAAEWVGAGLIADDLAEAVGKIRAQCR